MFKKEISIKFLNENNSLVGTLLLIENSKEKTIELKHSKFEGGIKTNKNLKSSIEIVGISPIN